MARLTMVVYTMWETDVDLCGQMIRMHDPKYDSVHVRLNQFAGDLRLEARYEMIPNRDGCVPDLQTAELVMDATKQCVGSTLFRIVVKLFFAKIFLHRVLR